MVEMIYHNIGYLPTPHHYTTPTRTPTISMVVQQQQRNALCDFVSTTTEWSEILTGGGQDNNTVAWAKVHKTNEGMPKFSNFQQDHLCHSHHCVNPNHIVFARMCKLLEDVNTNLVRDKCTGPLHCKCGERGVPCVIPGINHKGYRCEQLSLPALEEKSLRFQKCFPTRVQYLTTQSQINFLTA